MGYKWVSGSVLADGLTEADRPLVSKREVKSIVDIISPLEEARSCMEYGQLDLAKNILVKALAKDKENIMLQEELDYLIQYTKSREIQPSEDAS